MTIAVIITLLGSDCFKGYLIVTQSYRHLFPRTPRFSRFTRVRRNAHALIAKLASVLAEAQVGKGPLGGFAGFKLAAVIDSRGRFVRWALLPGNGHENDAEGLVAGLRGCLSDKGFRWLEGVLTPAYRLRGEGGGDRLAAVDVPGAELA